MNAPVAGSERQGAILDHEEVVLLRDPIDAGHIHRHSQEMNQRNGAGMIGEVRLDQIEIDVAGVRLGINEDARAAAELNGVGGGHV